MLATSEEILARNGLLYPMLPVPRSPRSKVWTSPFRHNCVAATYADFHSTFESLDAAAHDELVHEMRATDRDLILSAEEFSRQKDFSKIKDGLAGFDVTVIVYLRRQDLYMESLYNQRNKILVSRKDTSVLGKNFLSQSDMESFIKISGYAEIMNFHGLLKRVSDQLQPRDIKVRNFDRKQLVDGDVCKDFCCLLSINYDEMVRPVSDANQSIGNHILTEINETFLSRGPVAAQELMEEVCSKISSGKNCSGQYRILDDEARARLLEAYFEQNETLRREYDVSFT